MYLAVVLKTDMVTDHDQPLSEQRGSNMHVFRDYTNTHNLRFNMELIGIYGYELLPKPTSYWKTSHLA